MYNAWLERLSYFFRVVWRRWNVWRTTAHWIGHLWRAVRLCRLHRRAMCTLWNSQAILQNSQKGKLWILLNYRTFTEFNQINFQVKSWNFHCLRHISLLLLWKHFQQNSTRLCTQQKLRKSLWCSCGCPFGIRARKQQLFKKSDRQMSVTLNQLNARSHYSLSFQQNFLTKTKLSILSDCFMSAVSGLYEAYCFLSVDCRRNNKLQRVITEDEKESMY